MTLTRVDPSPGPRLALADYYIAIGRPDEAVPLLKSIGAEENRAIAAQIRLAGIDLRAKRFVEAERIVDGVLSGNSSDTEALLFKATILLGRGEMDDAAKSAQERGRQQPPLGAGAVRAGQAGAPAASTGGREESFHRNAQVEPARGRSANRARPNAPRPGSRGHGLDFAGQAVKNDPSSVEARIVLARALVAKKDLARAQEILTAQWPPTRSPP